MSTIMPGPLIDARDIKVAKTDVDPAPVVNKHYGRDRW